MTVVPSCGRTRVPAILGREAVRALHSELTLEPKPGLVTPRDCGSHADMTASTLLRAVFALRRYFADAARHGIDAAGFEALSALGQRAEARMLEATGGINTHRGAVFVLGLLCASAGRMVASQVTPSPHALRLSLLQHYGPGLADHALALRAAPARSHGQRAARLHGLRSAAEEAALGMPTLFEVTLPALLDARRRGASPRAARVNALMHSMAVLDDTNLAHRGGIDGLRFARLAASRFVGDGGVFRAGWVERVRAIHDSFVARRLSPGGSADLLGAACWIEAGLRRL